MPREIAALVKDNLDQAEDDLGRRRFLLANEANNQMLAGMAMARRAEARNASQA